MMLSMNLLGTELATFHGEVPEVPALPADAARPAGGFARLLGLGTEAAEPVSLEFVAEVPAAADGSMLPQDGKPLPPEPRQEAVRTINDVADDVPATAASFAVQSVPLVSQLGATAGAGQDPVPQPSITAAPRPESPAADAQRVAVQGGIPAAEHTPPTRDAEIRSTGEGGLPRPPLHLARDTAISATDVDEGFLTPVDGEGESKRPLARSGAAADRSGGQLSERDSSPRSWFESFRPTRTTEAAAHRNPLPAPPSAVSETVSRDALTRVTAPAAPLATAGPEASSALSPISVPNPASPAPAASLPRIDLPLQDPAWGATLNERVIFMTGKDLRNAEIRLNPADLGPIRVQLTVDDRGTHVNFTAHHAATREAIEQALPKLRELFTDQGLSLGQASVSDHGVKHDREGHRGDLYDLSYAEDLADDPDTISVSEHPIRAAAGLVDTFV